MKNISLSVLYSLLLVFSFNTAAIASDVTISGSANFACSFRATYMEKYNYYFIEETMGKIGNKKNIFAAKNAEVIIKNKDNTIVGAVKTDQKGRFSISVPEDKTYQIIVQFHNHKFEGTVYDSNKIHFIAYLGYFDSETVGSWLGKPTLTYCYNCDIKPYYINTTLNKAL